MTGCPGCRAWTGEQALPCQVGGPGGWRELGGVTSLLLKSLACTNLKSSLSHQGKSGGVGTPKLDNQWGQEGQGLKRWGQYGGAAVPASPKQFEHPDLQGR